LIKLHFFWFLAILNSMAPVTATLVASMSSTSQATIIAMTSTTSMDMTPSTTIMHIDMSTSTMSMDMTPSSTIMHMDMSSTTSTPSTTIMDMSTSTMNTEPTIVTSGKNGGDDELSVGAIAGIVIGIIAFFVIVAGALASGMSLW